MPRAPSPQVLKLSATEPFTLALPNRLFYDRRMIRQAAASDAVKVVPLIVQAIGHIAFVLTGTTDSQEAASILSDFFELFWTRGQPHQLSKCPGDGRRRGAGRSGYLL